MQESEEIMAKTSKFENTLMDIADFVDSNVYLRSIKDAFTDYVPFIICLLYTSPSPRDTR